MPPGKTLSAGPTHGTKRYKDRVTLMFCCNATGTDKKKVFDDWESCTAKMLQELQCPAHRRLRALEKGMYELKNLCQTKITGYFSAP